MNYEETERYMKREFPGAEYRLEQFDHGDSLAIHFPKHPDKGFFINKVYRDENGENLAWKCLTFAGFERAVRDVLGT